MSLSPTFPSDAFAPTQPVFPNLSPSEELHVLMARIAELTRATQVGPSVAGSEVFGQDGNGESICDGFHLDEEGQQQEDRRTPTMEASADQNIQNDLKEILERIGGLEKQQKQQNEQMTNIIAEQLAKVQNEIMEIGKLVKQQQEKEQKEKEQKEKEQKEKEQKEKEQKEKAILKSRMNFLDPFECNKDIEIIGNDRLTVHNKGNFEIWRNVFAKHPISLNKASDGIFYFEISIKQMKGYASFGFAFKKPYNYSLAGSLLGTSGSYALSGGGYFWINGKCKGSNAHSSFGVGDVVGIGVNLANRQMICTKNGRRLDSSNLFVDPSSAVDELFPFISLYDFDAKIEANIGPNFAFDLTTF